LLALEKENDLRKTDTVTILGLTPHILTLTYVLERPWWQWAMIKVKLVDGAVTQYGEVSHDDKK
jgi:hypothetical protein